MALLYAGRYSQFGGMLALVGAPVVILGISQGSTIAAQAMQAPAEVFRAYSVSAALTIVGGVALAKTWGLAGALAGLLASALGYCLMITWRCRKKLATELTNGRQCNSFDLSS
jgi:O-antigen/teichoic acid export membrane protein